MYIFNYLSSRTTKLALLLFAVLQVVQGNKTNVNEDAEVAGDLEVTEAFTTGL